MADYSKQSKGSPSKPLHHRCVNPNEARQDLRSSLGTMQKGKAGGAGSKSYSKGKTQSARRAAKH